ncbi:hypothetical protein CRE_12094 [Caenorhabditis remanei]|uniref:Uncharacterized protein n=1 Tax=Caenorhabditis remanei TaxID=31234 RepID=E3MPV5_CAERE|nr:hypothetical protein CRE_12094 [Caenorhabditis remanei]
MQKSRGGRNESGGYRVEIMGDNSSAQTESKPPTGVYPSDDSESTTTYSTATYKSSKKTTIEAKNFLIKDDGEEEEKDGDDDYDSMEEYQVTFPTVELKMPRHHHHRRRHNRRHRGPEHVTMTKQVDRRGSDCNDSVSEYTTYTYSTNPDRSSQTAPSERSGFSRTSKSSGASGATYNSTHRLQSLGNFFTSIIDFFRNNPKLSKLLFGIILCYVVVCNLEILIPRVIALFVRLCYPWARYSAVVGEQFFAMIANMFTRMDAVIFASYCEFAAKYCRSRRLMCDVTCSFVDHVLSQARPTLSPIPQN